MRKARKPQKENKQTFEKPNQLNWHIFNFLENLLVFCVVPERDAPPESGVHFRVSPREKDESLCLLFRIDRGKDSLFKADEIKPDYMVLYAKPDLCLCTIIEMKGTSEKKIKHGIEQIKALRDKLKTEIKKNLPNKLDIKFQAVILSPPNTELPLALIKDEEEKRGFTIKPVQYQFKAELFDYVSQEITLTKPKLKPEPIRTARDNSFVETILAENALPNRKEDDFYNKNKDKANNQNGVYINCQLSKNDYAALAMDNSAMTIAVKEAKKEFAAKIQTDLKKIGLNASRHYRIEKIN